MVLVVADPRRRDGRRLPVVLIHYRCDLSVGGGAKSSEWGISVGPHEAELGHVRLSASRKNTKDSRAIEDSKISNFASLSNSISPPCLRWATSKSVVLSSSCSCPWVALCYLYLSCHFAGNGFQDLGDRYEDHHCMGKFIWRMPAEDDLWGIGITQGPLKDIMSRALIGRSFSIRDPVKGPGMGEDLLNTETGQTKDAGCTGACNPLGWAKLARSQRTMLK